MEVCRHCGRDGTLRFAGESRLDSETQIDHLESGTSELTLTKVAVIQTCEGCQGVTLSTYLWVEEMMTAPGELGLQVLYPPEPQLDSLPENVAARYTEMLGAKRNPNDFSVGAGRTLEAVCSAESIPEHSKSGKFVPLQFRLEQLAASGKIPETIAKQAFFLKTLRNAGGHDSSIHLEVSDVPRIQRYVDVILDFIYRDPADFAKAEADWSARIEAQTT